METPTFPFFLGEKALTSSIFRSLEIEVLVKLLPRWISNAEEESIPIVDIHNLFLLKLKQNLEEKFIHDFSSYWDGFFRCLHNPIDKHSGKDMGQVFILIKNNVITEQPIAKEDIKLLHDYLFAEDDENHDKCIHLLRWLGFDLSVLADCFLKINSINNSFEINKCFYTIAINGMRGLTDYCIKAHDKQMPIREVNVLRTYTERFCIYIELLKKVSRKYSKTSQIHLALNLMEAAYLDGKIVRENELYSKESLKAMHSRSTSNASTKTSKKKEKSFEAVRNFVNNEYAKGSTFSTRQMTELIMSKNEFKSLSTDRVKRTIRSVKNKYGLDDRKNNRIADQKHKHGRDD